MLRDNLRQGGVLEALGAGCVLTGGGSRLPGLLDAAESLLRVPARIGTPVPLSRMPEELVAAGMRQLDRNAFVCPPHQRDPCGGRPEDCALKLRAIFARKPDRSHSQ